MGESLAAVSDPDADGIASFEKQSPTVSYGPYADALLVTVRRSPDAVPGDQVPCSPGRTRWSSIRRERWDRLWACAAPALPDSSPARPSRPSTSCRSVRDDRRLDHGAAFAHPLVAVWLGIAEMPSTGRAFRPRPPPNRQRASRAGRLARLAEMSSEPALLVRPRRGAPPILRRRTARIPADFAELGRSAINKLKSRRPSWPPHREPSPRHLRDGSATRTGPRSASVVTCAMPLGWHHDRQRSHSGLDATLLWPSRTCDRDLALVHARTALRRRARRGRLPALRGARRVRLWRAFETVLAGFDRQVTAARSDGAESMRFRRSRRAGSDRSEWFLDSFPQLLGTVFSFEGDAGRAPAVQELCADGWRLDQLPAHDRRRAHTGGLLPGLPGG